MNALPDTAHQPPPTTSAAPEGAFEIAIARKDFRAASGEAVPVVRGLHLALERHAFTCVTGPSGCGKTTTLRILLGLDDAYEGRIDPAFREGRIAAVFQEPRLLPWRTVERNVRLALPRDERDRNLDELFDAVGLSVFRDAYPSELSLGMARRAALARAFALSPDILVLDEPFVSLDDATATRLRRLLTGLWERDPVTVLMVTHNLREAAMLADRVVFLADRPTHVVANVPIAVPREERNGAELDRLVQELARRAA